MTLLRTRLRTIAVIAARAPARVALVGPDTSIQKPGHVAVSQALGDG